MVLSDKYYGLVAENYNADRCNSARWRAENEAVAEFVQHGPVLDVPLGTGRYIPIYLEKDLNFRGLDISNDMIAMAKRTYGDVVNAVQGSILEMPFSDKAFGTAVCTRLLDWLSPKDMMRAVSELRRVAHTVVLTIRHGKESVDVNYTHSWERFCEAISGMFIVDRFTTEISKSGTEEVLKLIQPTWRNVLHQFMYDGVGSDAALAALQRLGYEGLGRLDHPNLNISEFGVNIFAEIWSGEDLGKMLDAMSVHDGHAPFNSRFITNSSPRAPGQVIMVLEHEHRRVLIDGRRRCNVLRHLPGPHQVFVLRQK